MDACLSYFQSHCGVSIQIVVGTYSCPQGMSQLKRRSDEMCVILITGGESIKPGMRSLIRRRVGLSQWLL